MAMGRALALAAKGFQQTFGREGARVVKYGVATELRAQAGFSTREIEVAVDLTERRRAAIRGDSTPARLSRYGGLPGPRALARRIAGISDAVVRFGDRIHAWEIARSLVLAAIIYGAIFGIVYMIERRSGADPARYRTRHFANDVAYTLFYKGGFYNVLLLAVITNAFDSRLSFFLYRHLLTGVPCWSASRSTGLPVTSSPTGGTASSTATGCSGIPQHPSLAGAAHAVHGLAAPSAREPQHGRAALFRDLPVPARHSDARMDAHRRRDPRSPRSITRSSTGGSGRSSASS